MNAVKPKFTSVRLEDDNKTESRSMIETSGSPDVISEHVHNTGHQPLRVK